MGRREGGREGGRVEGRKEGWREGNLKMGGKVEKETRERFNLCSLQCAAGLSLYSGAQPRTNDRRVLQSL